ncbi:MAG: thioredoxin domain-containing protein [Patescibacteria group bacterium]
MAKTSKFFYLIAAVLVITATIFVLIVNRSENNQPAVSYQPIAGAKANSYELVTDALAIQANDNIIGAAEAPLKIFVYEDYSSQYSAELAETLSKIASESNDKVAIISRPYIVPGSNLSRQTALATVCAKDSGKWPEMRSLLFSLTKTGLLQEEGFSTYAAELQLNGEEFITCLTNEEKSIKLDEAMKNAKDALVLGAPTMFVGDEMILGARPYADFIDSNGDAISGLKTVVERKLKEVLAVE